MEHEDKLNGEKKRMNVKHVKFYDSRYFISQYVALLIIKYCKLNRTVH